VAVPTISKANPRYALQSFMPDGNETVRLLTPRNAFAPVTLQVAASGVDNVQVEPPLLPAWTVAPTTGTAPVSPVPPVGRRRKSAME